MKNAQELIKIDDADSRSDKDTVKEFTMSNDGDIKPTFAERT